MLPLSVLKHAAVAALDPAARWVLVALAGQFSGGNNGGLSLTRAVAREYGINSSDTLTRGLQALCEAGLAERTYLGSYRPPAPARYALTWHPMNRTEWTNAAPAATHAYRSTIFGDRPPVPAGPAIGPTKPGGGLETARMGPPTGPISQPSGTDHRSPLDIYQSQAERRAA